MPLNTAPNGRRLPKKTDSVRSINTQNDVVDFMTEHFAGNASASTFHSDLGSIPEPMGLAEQEMRGSSEALNLNRPDQSIPHQELAIEYLKQSQEQLMEQLQQRMQQMTGIAFGFAPRNLDPLGRPMGDDYDPNGDPFGSRVKIPDEAERRRVREILDLLRRRAGELNRPREEIEYYRRLLKRF